MPGEQTACLSVLLIEDDAEDAYLIDFILYKQLGCHVTNKQSLREGMVYLLKNKTDVVLLDLHLPDSTGIETVVKLMNEFQDIPVIVLTGLNDQDTALEAVKAGAQDYLNKNNIDQETLPRMIRYSIERNQLLKISKKNEEDLAKKEKELKQLNSVLKEMNLDLEERVMQEVIKNREKDILLIQQSRSAVAGEMVENIAHQWRQPISAVSLILQNIRFHAEKDKDISADFIMKEVNKGLDLIDYMNQTIEDFRMIFRNDQEKNFFSVREMIDKTLHIAEHRLKDESVEVIIKADEQIYIYGTRNSFNQVLMNLITNSLDVFSERKPENPRIVITAVHENGRNRIELRDNGGGIPEEILPRLMTEYLTTKKSGTGLGLFMCRNIVENSMNGQIKAYNDDEGAVFEMIFPDKI